MDGTFSGMTFGLVVGTALLVIALALIGSPLLAVIVLCVAAVFLLFGVSALRHRSMPEDGTPESAAARELQIPEAAGAAPPPSAATEPDDALRAGAQPGPDEENQADQDARDTEPVIHQDGQDDPDHDEK